MAQHGQPDDLKRSDHVLSLALGVTRSEDIASAVDRFDGIGVLVDGAGRGLLGALEEITDAEARFLLDLSVFGLIDVIRAVLPVMREAGHGKIAPLGSQSGFEGGSGASMYSASEFAAGLSEAPSAELVPPVVEDVVLRPQGLREQDGAW